MLTIEHARPSANPDRPTLRIRHKGKTLAFARWEASDPGSYVIEAYARDIDGCAWGWYLGSVREERDIIPHLSADLESLLSDQTDVEQGRA